MARETNLAVLTARVDALVDVLKDLSVTLKDEEVEGGVPSASSLQTLRTRGGSVEPTTPRRAVVESAEPTTPRRPVVDPGCPTVGDQPASQSPPSYTPNHGVRTATPSVLRRPPRPEDYVAPRYGNRVRFYLVSKGREIGIFDDWSEVHDSVDGYSGAEFKRYNSFRDNDVAMSDKELAEGEEVYAHRFDFIHEDVPVNKSLSGELRIRFWNVNTRGARLCIRKGQLRKTGRSTVVKNGIVVHSSSVITPRSNPRKRAKVNTQKSPGVVQNSVSINVHPDYTERVVNTRFTPRSLFDHAVLATHNFVQGLQNHEEEDFMLPNDDSYQSHHIDEGIQAEDGTDNVVGKPRKAQTDEAHMQEWLPHRQEYLDEFLRLDGPGEQLQDMSCASTGCTHKDELYRCSDCF
ncbi:hypothetical protein SISNIDRAFT_471835, partial [Sistotremastrum niveocremeum HHB9708]